MTNREISKAIIEKLAKEGIAIFNATGRLN